MNKNILKDWLFNGYEFCEDLDLEAQLLANEMELSEYKATHLKRLMKAWINNEDNQRIKIQTSSLVSQNALVDEFIQSFGI